MLDAIFGEVLKLSNYMTKRLMTYKFNIGKVIVKVC
jgi:hypothetical protein